MSTPAVTVATPRLAWLKALRAQALERVGVLTVPTVYEEAWRFTDMSALTRQSFHPLRTPTALHAGDIDALCLDEAKHRIVFVDGVHAPQLSSLEQDRGLFVSHLSAAVEVHAFNMAPHLGRHAQFRDTLFTAQNTAFLQEAAVVIVPRDTVIASPVHVLFISTQAEVASYQRVLLLAEAGSAVTLVEDYVALHAGAYLSNAVTEIVVGPNASVEHLRVQRESGQAFHIASGAVSLDRASRYHSVNIALGAQISRLALHVAQIGEAVECRLDGLALIGNEQLADTHTFIDHAKPHGMSRQLHKTIVDGAAHAVFNGQVMVRPGAQQTDSAQSSRNLLLSAKALVNTQPQLEIFADDVKCTHGATVGQLDSEAIFFLQSRGLSEAAARDLLTYAFGAEIIDRIPIPSLRRQLVQGVLEHTTREA
ncbi:MAG: Fe-S cluster assembly protein SufD [Burkholderiales bacterium]|nr:Fe-S cluster assembly protein SufD [Burkholderiales bacterium]